MLGGAYLHKGMHPEAAAYFQKATELSGDPVERLLNQYSWVSAMGDRDAELKTLEQLEQMSKHAHVSAYWIACLCANLGQKDTAIEWLNRAYEARDPDLGSLKVDPGMDPLHSDPRYVELVRMVGLAD